MSTTNVYRDNAEECLRIAETTRDKTDRQLWITMAQSWMRLAEQTRSYSAERASVEENVDQNYDEAYDENYDKNYG